MDMDKIWRLLTAIFLLLVGISLIVLADVVFQYSALGNICLIASYFIIPWGFLKGLFVILEYRQEQKEEE